MTGLQGLTADLLSGGGLWPADLGHERCGLEGLIFFESFSQCALCFPTTMTSAAHYAPLLCSSVLEPADQGLQTLSQNKHFLKLWILIILSQQLKQPPEESGVEDAKWPLCPGRMEDLVGGVRPRAHCRVWPESVWDSWRVCVGWLKGLHWKPEGTEDEHLQAVPKAGAPPQKESTDFLLSFFILARPQACRLLPLHPGESSFLSFATCQSSTGPELF